MSSGDRCSWNLRLYRVYYQELDALPLDVPRHPLIFARHTVRQLHGVLSRANIQTRTYEYGTPTRVAPSAGRAEAGFQARVL